MKASAKKVQCWYFKLPLPRQRFQKDALHESDWSERYQCRAPIGQNCCKNKRLIGVHKRSARPLFPVNSVVFIDMYTYLWLCSCCLLCDPPNLNSLPLEKNYIFSIQKSKCVYVVIN